MRLDITREHVEIATDGPLRAGLAGVTPGLVSGQAERELASGRVPHHDDSGCIQVMPLGILQKKLIGRTDVGKRSGPRPTFVAHAPEFEIGCSQSLRSQRCAEVPGVIEIVFRPPVTSVDIDDQWIW